MPASFNHDDLFGPGPRRFSEAPRGAAILTKSRINPFDPGSQPIGPLELTVIVRGRLIADNESDLWTRRDYFASQLTHPPITGQLTDDRGHEWNDMSFINFTTEGRTDRGRQTTLAYEATFIRFL